MSLTEQEKIKAQLIRYDLIKRIENIEIWISVLSERAVENLISLNIELSEFLIKDNSVLLFLLSSRHYVDDLEYIKNAKTETIFYCLVRFAESMSIIKEGCYPGREEYYEKDRNLIATAKSDEMARCLLQVAVDFTSLQSGHHERDMELIMHSEELIYILKELGNNTLQIVNQILENGNRYTNNEQELPTEVFKLEKNNKMSS